MVRTAPLTVFSLTVLFLTLSALAVPAQSWVGSHGMDTPYQPPRYLSGYGVSDLPDSSERLQAARNDALAALSRYTNTIQTATDLQITAGAGSAEQNRAGETSISITTVAGGR